MLPLVFCFGDRRISHLTQHIKYLICLFTLLVLVTERESVFVFKIKAAVHPAVDGIFSLCFAAGVWRSGCND